MARLDDFGGFGDFTSSPGSSPMDLTDFIAMALLKRALRSAGLHHVLTGAPCTLVVAGIPEGTANLFTDTVGKLFRRPGRDPNGTRSKVHDRTGTRVERSRSVDTVVPSLRSNWSTAWLYDSTDKVPPFLREIADGVANLAPPDDRLMLAIVSKVRATQPMGRRDLDALRSLPWHLLVGFLEEGRPLRSATQLAGRVEAARRREDGEPEKISDAVATPGAVVDGPTLDNLHGLGEAVAWGRALAVDLADYKAGRIGWSEVDRGALVTGPPGTGKTTFALALGRSCGVPVHVHSLARWQAAGYLNALLKEMRTAFSEAIANAPCILFVDELDSFGDRAVVDDHNARYTREVVNSFLECLDGAEARTGVVVVGATNHPGLIDPAIRRAGRLDREIVIPLPDADARAQIARYHLREDLAGADLTDVADAMEGKSGADIEALVRAARRTARTARRPMRTDDLLGVLPPAVRLNDAAFRRVCTHEAGHVVVGQALAAVSGSVPVRAVARRELRVAGSSQTEFTVNRGDEAILDSYLDLVTTMLGGMAAELEIRIDEGFYTSVKANLRLMGGKKTFDDLTDAQAAKVLKKIKWCDRYLKLESHDRSVKRSDAKLEIAIARIAAEFKAERDAADARRRAEHGLRKKRGGSKQDGELSDPSPFQLRRWVAKYTKGGLDKDALVDQYNGPGRKRLTLCSASYELHAKFAAEYASSTRPTKAQQFSLLEIALDDADAARAEAGKPPLRRLKRRAFEKMIDALDPFFVDLGRLGYETALRLHGIVNAGLDVEKPFERLEIDEWNVSLMRILVDAGVWGLLEPWQREVVERSRVWLSVAIDARTRMIVAMRFLPGAPCVESAMSTIELAMTDKSRIAGHLGTSRTYLHAKPRSIAMDNGVNYTAEEVIRALVHLNIHPIHPPAGLAEMRARIERIFGTLKTKIASYFTGQTFSNVVEKGDYDAQANASLNLEELNRVFLVGVLDLYHHHPHEGLEGETPYDCMRRLSAVYGLPLPPNRDVLRHVMGVVCERRIGEEGIRFLGIRYQSPQLQRLSRAVGQKPVQIRVDRLDLSSISVRLDNGGWIVCDARFAGLENVSIWQWTEAVRDLRHRNASVAALSRHHVLSAVRTLSEAAAAAVERAEIAHPVVTAKTFEHFEETLFRGFEFVDDGAYGEDLELPEALARQVEEMRARGALTAATDEPAEDHDDGYGDASEWSSN